MIELVGLGNITNEPYPASIYYGQEVPFAIFVFLFSLASLVLYVIVMLALHQDSDYKNLMAYQIMFHIGIADCLQLLIHFSTGFYILDGHERYRIWERIIGAVMNGSWCTMLVLSILLTVNRLVSIVFHFESKVVFSKFMLKIYLGICWMFCIIIISLNLTPWCRFYYVVPTYTFHYEAGRLLSSTIRRLSANISLAEVCIGIFCYACIFLYIYFKAAILSKREVYLTIQVLLLSVFHILGFFIWEYWFLPDHPVATFFGHFVWMAWNSISAILHVAVSPRIRKNVYQVLGMEKGCTDLSQNSKRIMSVVTT
ncbi:unnamed protein product [Auanema sp. JU1783]|nr:unnamed protein product [Auanema sp. JU1783]